ncbi:FAD-binding protein, partial [Micromonospora yasonensis]|uniref:FAD-binding protein n=1 Tax=Micromonospora yasonensis TaxID=1128667 RepID=UPI002231F665
PPDRCEHLVTGPGLRVAVLAKQVRVFGEQEINPYCRRAIAYGVQLARRTAGTCTVFTMGPPSARDVLAEALGHGAGFGVHVCDPALAAADLLVTARALAAAVAKVGPFDLILLGSASLDAETAQLGPHLAGLLDLPFTGAARQLEVTATSLEATCEQDDRLVRVGARLPAVVAVAERLCAPAKVPAHARPDPTPAMTVLDLAMLAGAIPGAASPTAIRPIAAPTATRSGRILSGPVAAQVSAALAELRRRGALDGEPPPRPPVAPARPGAVITVLADPYHDELTVELLGAAADIGGTVRLLCGPGRARRNLAAFGADEIWRWAPHDPGPAAVAAALTRDPAPGLLLAPATAWGRTVAGRYAAVVGAGLIADATSVTRAGGTTVATVAGGEVRCETRPTVVTVGPGVLPMRTSRGAVAVSERPWDVPPASADVIVHGYRTVDDYAALTRAASVVCVGLGVDDPTDPSIRALLRVLGAELAATRKLTDAGVLPRSRQVGVTGRGVRPRLYVAIGVSGKPHHIAAVAGAGTILAINSDPEAPIFATADVGIVAPWQEVVPALVTALSARSAA